MAVYLNSPITIYGAVVSVGSKLWTGALSMPQLVIKHPLGLYRPRPRYIQGTLVDLDGGVEVRIPVDLPIVGTELVARAAGTVYRRIICMLRCNNVW